MDEIARSRRASAVALLTLTLAFGVLAAFIVSGGEAQPAATVLLTASLDARQEVPKPKRVPGAAKGTFTATLVPASSGGTITWRLTFSRLSGRATAAHVHVGKRGRPGPIAVALCGPCTRSARGSTRVTQGAIRALRSGGAYVNVHTVRNPAGEIRGQILARSDSGSSPPPPQPTPPPTEPEPYPPYP
jgi:hypothetical protein